MEKINKKKIVIFIPEFPVLTETFIQRDIVKLVEFNNLDLKILCLRKNDDWLNEKLKDRVFEINLTFLDVLSSLNYIFTKKEELKKIRHVLKGDLALGVLKRCYLLLKSLGYAKLIGKYKPEEIHVHFYSDFSSIGMFAAIILDVSFSINAHARDIFEYPHLPQSKANMAKFVSVCNGLAHKRCMEISKVGEDKIHLIYHGIDAKRAFPTDLKTEKYDVPTIFLGGTRITEKKGIEYMVEASKILKDRGIKHRVNLVGVGPGYEALLNKIEENNLKDTFYILGDGKGMPFDEMAKYYFSADIFALPIIQTSMGDSDGIPNVIIEAALARLPIITTDAGSVSELIKNDETGVVVPQKDSQTLADEIEKLIFDDEKKKRISEAAYNKAVEMFDSEKNVRKLEKLLLN